MRFMIIRKADRETEAGVMPSDDLILAMTRYNEALIKAGVMLDGQGLKPSSAGARMRFRAGKASVVDGPFSETKELIAGFTMIDVTSRDEAIEWMKRWPVEDGHGEVELELRPVYEIEDFGDSAALDELRARGTMAGR